ncbi:MAG: enoyl-CoA hydratase/isomerase family protein, partial [Solirubrobacteraceae bacterium]
SGQCVGAGLQLASVCDVRIAGPDAVFVATAPAARLVPGMSWWRLPRMLGTGRAKYLIMASSGIDALEALRIGLVDEVVDGDPVPRGEAVARRMFDFAPAAFAETKRLVNAAQTMSHDQAVAEFLVAELRCLAAADTPGSAERIAAAQRTAMTQLDDPDPVDGQPATRFDPRW